MIDYRSLQQQYEINVFPKRDIVLVRGEGARVWDSEGKEYIDCMAGHGTVSIGHCNPAIVKAISEQASTLMSCSNALYNNRRAELIRTLVGLAPVGLNRVFLCNSGTEAIEAAIKFARLTTGRPEFVCAMRGFHGRTYGAMSATHDQKYKQGSEPLLPGFKFAPFNNDERFEAEVTDNTAGIILELVQGEGGVNIADLEFITKIRQLCQDRNILLIIDEVQTGFCRTGKMFACEHYGITPDILCLAKGIAGGLPMGAIICNENISVTLGSHGTTFGGNPLLCAAASATIDFMVKEDLVTKAQAKGNYFVSHLSARTSSRVRAIRHLGLMVGIELKEKAHPYITEIMQRGVLVLPAGPTVVRLLPPLTISYAELEKVAETVSAAIQ